MSADRFLRKQFDRKENEQTFDEKMNDTWLRLHSDDWSGQERFNLTRFST